MNKEQFNKLKAGDIVEYNYKGVLEGCQFKIKTINYSSAEGTVTKAGTAGVYQNTYPVGAAISSHLDNITLVSASATNEPFATLSLSVQEAAVLFRLLRSVWGSEETSVRKFTGSISAKLSYKFPKMNCLDDIELFTFAPYELRAKASVEQLNSALVDVGLLQAPEKPKAAARHRVKGPDGKWAPKNYRVVMYPEHGSGKPIKRHVLWGDFVMGTKGTNVYVEEWDAAAKKWCPKTYSLSKVGVAE